MEKNLTIAESFVLPSKGKIYRDSTVVPQVRLRSMTTSEEQKRLAHSDYPYKMLCEIIDDCLLDNPGISTYDMCLGDYQFLLHKLRVVTYGSEYKMDTVCPYCGCTAHESVNLDDLPVLEYSDDILKYFEFSLPKTNHIITLKSQTPRMLDNVSEKVREYRKRNNGSSYNDPTLTYTISSLIDLVDGKTPDLFKLDQWVESLPMADVNTIISYAEKCNSLMGIDTTLQITCDICGLGYTSQMRMTQEFFRPSLNI